MIFVNVEYACLILGGIARAIHVSKKIETDPRLKLEANNNDESPGKLNLSE